MPEAVFIVRSERNAHTPIVGFSENSESWIMGLDNNLIIFYRIRKYRHSDRKGEFSRVDLEESGFFRWIDWKVEESRHFISRQNEVLESFSFLDRSYRGIHRSNFYFEFIEGKIFKEGKIMKYIFGDALCPSSITRLYHEKDTGMENLF